MEQIIGIFGLAIMVASMLIRRFHKQDPNEDIE
jgi:hypothetical protein